MKKITLTLALILCLVLCVFAFASCAKNNKTAETTAAPTAPSTTATPTQPATEQETDPVPACDHVPENEWIIESEPTCIAPGVKVLYCEVCGAELQREAIPVDLTKHVVAVWSAEPTLLNPTVHRTGECTICHTTLEDDATFEPDVQTFDPTSGRHHRRMLLSEVQGEDHFYPTDENLDGKDLMIEYSVLWNETLQNITQGTGGGDYSYITARLANSSGTTATPFIFWTTINNSPYADCKFAGGFETSAGVNRIPAAGAAFTPAGITSGGQPYDQYPNIGGADQDNPEWGWHRIQYRLHQDVTNLAELEADTEAGATKAAYKLTVTLYIDGVAAAMLEGSSGDSYNNLVSTNYLYSAESDGEGGIVYGDNEHEGVYVYALLFNSGRTNADTTAYWVDADVSITCGTEFVQQVEKVASPAAATLEVAEGIEIPAPIYFKLAD